MNKALAVLLLPVLMVGCFGGEKVLSEQEQRQKLVSDLRFYSVAVCERVVPGALVSPSTAVFERGTGGSRQFEVVPDSLIVRLTHFVDSQNRMGGTMRTRFRCEVRHNGQPSMSSGWELLSLVFLDQ